MMETEVKLCSDHLNVSGPAGITAVAYLAFSSLTVSTPAADYFTYCEHGAVLVNWTHQQETRSTGRLLGNQNNPQNRRTV